MTAEKPAAHTPGSWQVRGPGQAAWAGWLIVGRPDHKPVSLVATDADARLISAAPDLLAACEILLSRYAGPIGHDEGCGCIQHLDVEAVRAAIAKAKGGTP